MGHEDAELVGPEELSPARELWETVEHTSDLSQPSARQPLFTALGPLLLEDTPRGMDAGPSRAPCPDGTHVCGWNKKLSAVRQKS